MSRRTTISRPRRGPLPDAAAIGAVIEAAEAAALGVHRSLGGRRWLWREAEGRVALGIAQRLGVPEIIGRLLAGRGVGIEAAEDFLDPRLRALMPDPSVLADMEPAAARLAEAAQRAETVAVFGDYDVDGACSAALMVSLMRALGCTVISHVPDRLAEGYGPNAAALAALVARGAGLIVCVDCGTAAEEALGSVRGRADVVVLDHHKSEAPPPPVLATVNPNRVDDSSGLGGLCATAVAFMAAVALLRTLRRAGFFAGRPEPDLLALLDLVALATVCDVMPLTGLNRAFVVQGLRVMARRARPGIAALLDVAQAKPPLSAFTCGFALGPRINAAGRIDEAGLGLRLLLSEDAAEAAALAERLDGVNRQRQVVEAGMLEAALAAAGIQAEAGHPVLLVSGAEWHPGVVGIVAGRIRERFNRPACVAAVADGRASGSGRSVPGCDLGAAVIAARQAGLLATGGGHAMAAGFALPAGNLPAFHAFLNERLAAAATLPAAADLAVEGTLAVAGAGVELAQQIGRLAPFGAANEEPVLALPRVRVVRADRIGRDGTSLRLFIEGEGGGPRLRALHFRARDGALAEALLASGGRPLHLAGHLRAEAWNGSVSVSFVVIDAAWA
ncbi:MAG TPA: single-stranded-DNA-specific exonuclease RecJ [Acetobacteraceae bacterium]|nr:single-stranded-DNA-specific exonuclease RecJ [Acetobacteraceae bacterium]